MYTLASVVLLIERRFLSNSAKTSIPLNSTPSIIITNREAFQIDLRQVPIEVLRELLAASTLRVKNEADGTVVDFAQILGTVWKMSYSADYR